MIYGNSTDVNIPFDHHFHTEPILPFNTWGSFRAIPYFGLQTSSPDSPLIGLVWFNNNAKDVSALHVRHWCEQDDGLTYGWKYHNFDDFGFQTIKDNDYNFNTSFIKYAADNWKALVSVNQTNAKPINSNNDSISLIIYLSIQRDKDVIHIKLIIGKHWYLISLIIYLSIQRDKDVIHINGYNSSSIQITGFNEFIGNFSLNITSQGDPVLYSGQLDSDSSIVDVIKEIKSNLTPIVVNGTQIYELKTQKVPSRSQLIAYQVVFREQTKLMIEFNVKNQLKEKLSNVGDYDNDMKERIRLFGQEFDTKFGLKGKGFNEKQITFAQSVLSEMLGSIGYFNGNLSVDSPGMKSPKTYGPLEMLSAVPSRPRFPRPFLWDEGFHNLVIQRWNSSLTLKIMNSWFNIMNIDGWIPREIVIGNESIAKFGSVNTQTDVNANPPSFLLTIDSLIKNKQIDVQFLKNIYPKLKAWFQWYNTTQSGELIGTYRWRGRNPEMGKNVLNPDTLTSGLDDYPRATHPTDKEYHLDLRCWIWLAADIMSRIADTVADSQMKAQYEGTAHLLADNSLLEKLHWSESDKAYCDYGYHSTNVSLVKGVRKVWTPPKYQLTCDQLGYVNLFPFMFGIIDANNTKLGYLLDSIHNSSQMWTNHGLRSISKTSFYYNKWNNEGEVPYWRGPIWININYLMLRSLRHYADIPGPNQSKAALIYKELRNNIIESMFTEYERSGFVWETYNDMSGTGQHSHPFVGWSGVVVLIMSEHY
ncbi:unnamed protein product [Oppiella nova]|uniref:Mannosyl-oligosaccharide glucosidase n=1 Tax=Oppiella nova TaxID=334625 RepID=A0A7R9M0Y5_9ACAR|nr:unnamed protein product [Oppiella nova]CAG2168886.1 unnamed protein product [Oppiella nova]